jgi:integrase
MPRQFALTYDKSLHQWVKVIKGRKHYFGKGRSKTNPEDYQKALAAYEARLPEILAAAESPRASDLSESPRPTIITSNRRKQQLATAVARYFQYQELRATGSDTTNRISSGRVIGVKGWLRPFLNHFGDRFALHTIGSEAISEYSAAQRRAEANGDISANTLFQRFAILKNFLRWCWEEEIIRELPRNLRRELKFGIPTPDRIDIFHWRKRDGEEVQRLLKACEERDEFLYMCVLLGLNCGYGLKDIADLRMEQFLWKGKDYTRLKRGRSKTGIYGSHILWSRTEELMRKYARGRYKTTDLCFTMPDGSPILREYRGAVVCPLARDFKNVVQALFGSTDKPDRRSWRTLRKTGATYCARSTVVSNADTLYLAHQPKTMAAKFYAETPFHRLDQVLCYMESDFGVTDHIVERWKKSEQGRE